MTPFRLVPETFPDMPAIAGLSLGTAATGLKYTGRDDLMLMRCAEGSTLAAVFTQSDTAAPPVEWSRERLAEGTAISAILVNAGNANALRVLQASRPFPNPLPRWPALLAARPRPSWWLQPV